MEPRQRTPFSPFQHCAEGLTSFLRPKKTKSLNIRKDEVKLLVLTDIVTIYRKHPKGMHKELPDLGSEFSKVSEYVCQYTKINYILI